MLAKAILVQSRDTSWTRIKWHHCQGPLRGHESAETPIGNESGNPRLRITLNGKC